MLLLESCSVDYSWVKYVLCYVIQCFIPRCSSAKCNLLLNKIGLKIHVEIYFLKKMFCFSTTVNHKSGQQKSSTLHHQALQLVLGALGDILCLLFTKQITTIQLCLISILEFLHCGTKNLFLILIPDFQAYQLLTHKIKENAKQLIYWLSFVCVCLPLMMKVC